MYTLKTDAIFTLLSMYISELPPANIMAMKTDTYFKFNTNVSTNQINTKLYK